MDMKTIGIIGGMSWESSAEYYKLINKEVIDRLGKQHSARVTLFTVDFKDVEGLHASGNLDELAGMVTNVAKLVEQSGAHLIIIASNTMHKVLDRVQPHVKIPIIHIADAVGEKVTKEELKKVGLLGSEIIMDRELYIERLQNKFDIDLVLPTAEEQVEVDRIIADELVVGEFKPTSQAFFIQVLEEMKAQGAEGVILGCTEIPILVRRDESPLPIFDMVAIHAQAAVTKALRI